MFDIRRREFITLFGGAAAAAAWPRAALTQQLGKPPRIAYIRPGTANNDAYRDAIVRGMSDLGYVEGHNIAFEFRYYGDEVGSIAALISNLLQTKIDVIVAGGTPAVRAAQAATQGIPIVMIAADPLSSGLIAGLARPGSNTTGISMLSSELTVKRLELLKELMPQAVRIAILRHPGNPVHEIFIEEIQSTTGSLAFSYRIFDATRPDDFERSFTLMQEWLADAVVVLDDGSFISYRAIMADESARRRLPLVCGFPEMTRAGCLYSYSVSLVDMWYRSARYVDKILKGAKPADLPVEHGTKFEFVLNLTIAKALDINVSRFSLARADELIE
jgi:putative ABC transport system substrate-binding protein